jgi:hypothetical protein
MVKIYLGQPEVKNLQTQPSFSHFILLGPVPPDQALRAGRSRPMGMTGVTGLKSSGKGRAGQA